jgi:Fe-S cluster assembly iron-binding protein IscA
VRIAAPPEGAPEGRLEVALAATPAEEDQVIEEGGAHVFLESRAADV